MAVAHIYGKLLGLFLEWNKRGEIQFGKKDIISQLNISNFVSYPRNYYV